MVVGTADWAETIVAAAAIYLAAGLVFALVFAFLLVARVSPDARTSAPLQFRLIILPGLILLWPLAAAAAVSRAAGRSAPADPGGRG